MTSSAEEHAVVDGWLSWLIVFTLSRTCHAHAFRSKNMSAVDKNSPRNARDYYVGDVKDLKRNGNQIRRERETHA